MKIVSCCDCTVKFETSKMTVSSRPLRCKPCKKVHQKEYQKKYHLDNKPKRKVQERENRLKLFKDDPARMILSNCYKRTNHSGHEFSITKEDITIPDKCPILGTLFTKNTMYTYSLDRIDNDKGYIPGNVQVISKLANAMKNSASPEELLSFAKWVIENYPPATEADY